MQTLTTPDHLKILGHPQRLQILQFLMRQAATLSQLGVFFNETAAHIRHHIKLLEQEGLVILTDPPPIHNHLEKYYRATEEAWLVQLAILPQSTVDAPTLVLASKDLAARRVVHEFGQTNTGLDIQFLPLNSLDGLMRLRQGLCQMATCHLKDPDSGQYNRSFVRHLFPGQEMAVIPLYQREEGLIVRTGNPLGIRELTDLVRPNVRFINRERGSGIRLWLDQALKAEDILPEMIDGYREEARSHAEVADAIRQGRAEAGLGIAAAARTQGLDFVPLFEEPYELVLPIEQVSAPAFAPFFDHVHSGAFRATVQNLDGYLISPTSGQVDRVF